MIDSMQNKQENNELLYALKGISSILVIFIHCRFPGALGDLVNVFARIAVPMFFYINGRFMLNRGVDGLKSKTFKLIKKLLLVLVIYNLFSFSYYLINSKLSEWFSAKCSIKEIFSLLIFNSSRLLYDDFISVDHLWYGFALLNVIIIVLITKGKLNTLGFVASQFPLLLFFLFYYLFLNSINSIPWHYLRNFASIALPFIYLGIYCNKNNDEIRNIADKINPILLLILFIAGFGLSESETYLFGIKDVNVGTILSVIALILLSEKKFMIKPKVFSYIGKRFANETYYWHVLFISLGRVIFPDGKLGGFEYVRPLIIVFLSLAFAGLLDTLKRKYKSV